MRIVLQRVQKANVHVSNEEIAKIGIGLVVLVGIEDADNEEDVDWIINKIIQMRIFQDNEGKMNLSLQDLNGELLVISQFTLHASTKKGNRPSFIQAAKPQKAIPLYTYMIEQCQKVVKTATGIFGADMQVSLVNDGPVTILLDSKNKG